MIKVFKELNNKFNVIYEGEYNDDAIEENSWIHITNPSLEDVQKICAKTELYVDMLTGALDSEESAHLDIDDDNTLITLDIPVLEEQQYETIPFSIMYNTKYMVTMCSKETNLVANILQKFKKIEPHKHVRLSLQIMYRIATLYIMALTQIDKKTKDVESILHSSMKNKELFQLMSINKSLVYLSTSLNANKVVLTKVARLPEYKKYEADFDLLEDVEIENNQAIEMCSIYRDILAGSMDAYASIISNNLNIVMKVLAIITLILSIPTLVASLFGMNVDVPLNNTKAGFWIIIAISCCLSIIGSVALWYFSSKRKIK